MLESQLITDMIFTNSSHIQIALSLIFTFLSCSPRDTIFPALGREKNGEKNRWPVLLCRSLQCPTGTIQRLLLI